MGSNHTPTSKDEAKKPEGEHHLSVHKSLSLANSMSSRIYSDPVRIRLNLLSSSTSIHQNSDVKDILEEEKRLKLAEVRRKKLADVKDQQLQMKPQQEELDVEIVSLM